MTFVDAKAGVGVATAGAKVPKQVTVRDLVVTAVVASVLSLLLLAGGFALFWYAADAVRRTGATATAPVQRNATEGTSERTKAAWTEILAIDRKVLGSFTRVDGEYAAAVARHYPGIALTGVDLDLRLWVEEVIQGAEQLAKLKTDRANELARLDQERDAKALNWAAGGAEKLGGTAETPAGQLFRGFIGAAGGAGLSGADDAVRRDGINASFDERMSAASSELARRVGKRAELFRDLKARYGW